MTRAHVISVLLNQYPRFHTTAYAAATSQSEPGTSFHVPRSVRTALKVDVRTSYALDVLEQLLGRSFQGHKLGESQLYGCTKLSVALPASPQLGIWRRLAADRAFVEAERVVIANEDESDGSPEALIEALCALGQTLTPAAVLSLRRYQSSVATIAGRAAELLIPETIQEWISLLSHQPQRGVPYDNPEPACIVCHEDADEGRSHFLVNAVCTSHQECVSESDERGCHCQALLCIECAATLFQRHYSDIMVHGPKSRRIKCPQCSGRFCFVDLQPVSKYVDSSQQLIKRRRLAPPEKAGSVEPAAAAVQDAADGLTSEM
jgi:hypothetical protein